MENLVFGDKRIEKFYQALATAISNYYDGQYLEADIDCWAAQYVDAIIKDHGKYEEDK